MAEPPQPARQAARGLPGVLIRGLPFHYGWVVLGAVCCAGLARQGPAVAVLSIFVEPMCTAFGWSRTAMSGAVSLGGVLAAFASPVIGPVLDRRGARLVLCAALAASAAACAGLSLIHSLAAFYLLFGFARMTWAGPFDLGIYGALNNWFVARRAFATAIVTAAQTMGLVLLPLVGAAAMAHGGWRSGWLAIAATMMAVGFVPAWLFVLRRPEDVGLLPDAGMTRRHAAGGAVPEPAFTRGEAMRTRAFWLLALFTALAYPVQAGVSLHQAPHLIERGLSPAVAASVVSTFSLGSGAAGLAYGLIARVLSTRLCLALVGACMTAGPLLMLRVHSAGDAYLAGVVFGSGLGGLLTMLPIAWADYFGRRSYGAIRGVALSIQVAAQACGPVLSGALRDVTGDYVLSLECFAGLAVLATLAALAGGPPPRRS